MHGIESDCGKPGASSELAEHRVSVVELARESRDPARA